MLKTQGRVVAARLGEAVAGSKKRRPRRVESKEPHIHRVNTHFWHGRLQSSNPEITHA